MGRPSPRPRPHCTPCRCACCKPSMWQIDQGHAETEPTQLQPQPNYICTYEADGNKCRQCIECNANACNANGHGGKKWARADLPYHQWQAGTHSQGQTTRKNSWYMGILVHPMPCSASNIRACVRALCCVHTLWCASICTALPRYTNGVSSQDVYGPSTLQHLSRGIQIGKNALSQALHSFSASPPGFRSSRHARSTAALHVRQLQNPSYACYWTGALDIVHS